MVKGKLRIVMMLVTKKKSVKKEGSSSLLSTKEIQPMHKRPISFDEKTHFLAKDWQAISGLKLLGDQ